MHLRWLAFAAAMILSATPSVAEPIYGSGLMQVVRNGMPEDSAAETKPVIFVSNEKRQEPDVDMYALMSGTCSTLKIAGHDFKCRTVAFFHSPQGRANFTIALDDPADDSHIILFSGEDGRREQDDLYELPIDRMLLNSKDRPRVDGLPVPSAQSSTGQCRQLGNFATGQVSSISCSAIDRNGRTYELQFESDGSPMIVRRITQSPLPAERRRVRQNAQIGCRRKAYYAKVLPRDLTAYLIGCLAEEDDQQPAAAEPQ
ncbi:hypothetical protein [Bradyrhizobium sp.]|jgi:hypothetical protein|uniref:hypothetical protein n=1 Tax=Bradyrhizobium sp. TaxID=376 RepID=UPI003C24772F